MYVTHGMEDAISAMTAATHMMKGNGMIHPHTSPTWPPRKSKPTIVPGQDATRLKPESRKASKKHR